jgi:uncharacterized protein YkwD
MLRALGFALVLLVSAGCADGGMFASKPPPPDPQTVMPALENRIFELIQDERHKIDPNAKTLALDSELAGVARLKSADMAQKNYLAHKAPDGQTTADIIMDKDANFQGLLGENIAEEHYTKLRGVDVEGFANEFVDTWLGSDGHKQNLAFAAYNRTGVGAAVSGDTVYVTQLFATDMGLPLPDLKDPATHKISEYSDPKSAAAPPAGATAAVALPPQTVVVPKRRPRHKKH